MSAENKHVNISFINILYYNPLIFFHNFIKHFILKKLIIELFMSITKKSIINIKI